jgi:hypothetical protein
MQNTTSNFLGTTFDVHSIMNYSYCVNGEFGIPYRLSGGDIVGAQNAYHRHTPQTLVAASGGCLDVPLLYSPELVQIYGCNSGSNQKWSYSRANHHLFVSSLGAYLDVIGASTANGQPVAVNGLNTPPREVSCGTRRTGSRFAESGSSASICQMEMRRTSNRCKWLIATAATISGGFSLPTPP